MSTERKTTAHLVVDVYQLVSDAAEPVTIPIVVDALDVGRVAAAEILGALVERGMIQRRGSRYALPPDPIKPGQLIEIAANHDRASAS